MAILNRATTTAAEHAEAFRNVLKVTRRAWSLTEPAPGQSHSSDSVRTTADSAAGGKPDARANASKPPTLARNRRQGHLARAAARAFEAQVIALRCRQAFVG